MELSLGQRPVYDLTRGPLCVTAPGCSEEWSETTGKKLNPQRLCMSMIQTRQGPSC